MRNASRGRRRTVLTRRQLLDRGAGGTAGLMFAGAVFERSAFGATSVAGTLTPYADPMPTLVDNLIDTRGVGSTVNLSTYLITRKLHRDLPPTTLFGYLKPSVHHEPPIQSTKPNERRDRQRPKLSAVPHDRDRPLAEQIGLAKLTLDITPYRRYLRQRRDAGAALGCVCWSARRAGALADVSGLLPGVGCWW